MCHSELVKCLGRETQNCRPLKYARRRTLHSVRVFYLSTSLFVERGYISVEDLIKLEKLSDFWIHNELLQVWHRNTHLQKQVQAKNSSSEFTNCLNQTVLENKQRAPMKQKGTLCRDQGDKGGFSYSKWRGRQLIHQW